MELSEGETIVVDGKEYRVEKARVFGACSGCDLSGFKGGLKKAPLSATTIDVTSIR